VLTYAHAGAELLTQALSASTSLACTSGTGLLPVCHAAVSTWQRLENRDGVPSALGIKSVRELARTMVTVIQAGAGASRWCETAITSAAAAGTFLQLFPTATFLCHHRSLRGVIAEGLRAYPWGLGGSPFWSYSGAHPGNNVATIAAYWAACTESLLEFQARHPQSCLRIRREDIIAAPDRAIGDVYLHLGLDTRDLAVMHQPREQSPTVSETSPDPQVPADQIPPWLLSKINDMHTRLGYPACVEDLLI